MTLRLGPWHLALFLLVAAVAKPALALQFDALQVAGGDTVLFGRGPIVAADAARLARALGAAPQGGRILGLVLDSPGGSVTEAEMLSKLIRGNRLAVLIPADGKCVSACFLLLAGSMRRLAAADALIGVHSANEDGEETATSLAVTTMMARDADRYGIPPGILGKMVRTRPDGVDWLTHADLSSMNVTVFEGDSLGALRQATGPDVTVPRTDPARAAITPVAPVARANDAFRTGAAERLAWDRWVGSLHGAYRDGVLFAQAEGQRLRYAACLGPGGENRGDFTLGCDTALHRLSGLQARMQADPGFAAGWNAQPQARVAGPARPAAVDADYQGAFFCGRQVGWLSVKLLSAAGDAPRRAIVSFGPQATSPDVPHGAFLAQGRLEAAIGTVELSPVQWLQQPPNYPWLGLAGRSDDGGRTFSGQVTQRAGCSQFTLGRIARATAGR